MLSANSILDELRRLHDSGKSGILALKSSNGERVSFFLREGMIEAASSSSDTRRLGEYLRKQAQLQPQQVESAKSEAQRQNLVLGEAVVRKRLLSQIELSATVRSQAVDLLEHVVKNGFSVDSFTSALPSYYTPARISFPHVLLELSRKTGDLFEPRAGSCMVLSNHVNLSSFPWYPQELSVLSQLAYPNTFERVLLATSLEENSLKRILGVLDRLGVIECVDCSDSTATEALRQSDSVLRQSEFSFEHLIPVVTNAVLNEKLEAARDEFSFTTEQFKNLKVQISETNPTRPVKVLTISSPDSQDGKSLISTNLAFSFAKDLDRRIIVVDCDLRNPSLGDYLGVPSEPGLLQYLSNGHLSPYCYVRRIENLYFLTAGGIAPNPIEILSMQKMKQLIDCLKRDFDTIILDAPPYSPIADARVVTGLSDGLILVVRRGKTSYSSTDRAFKSIDRNKLLGVVFNDVQPMLFHTYYNFGYYYYGSKQHIYSNGETPKKSPKNYLQA